MEDGFKSLEMLSTTEIAKFNAFGKGPRRRHPFSLLHHGFEINVNRNPSAIAVIQHHDDTSITYGELERRANILANTLIQQGLPPRQRVLLVLQRSIEMTIAILAVLKAGCQYIPLDGGIVPEATLKHILSDTQAPLVLCSKKFENKVLSLALGSTKIVALDSPELQNMYRQDGDERRPSVALTRKDGAYIIYTSGMLLLAHNVILQRSIPNNCRNHGQSKGCRCFPRKPRQRPLP
jgi:acyl-CoA synthetase (AMP-forming)/AMP-acid ligase II